MIAVRVARPDDADAVADAHVEAWRVGYRDVYPDELLDAPEFAAARREGWRRGLGDGSWPAAGESAFVVEVAGRVVGFGHVGPEAADAGDDEDRDDDDGCSGRGEVYGFYVHPDAWGSGCALALMQACTDALAARHRHAVLWTLAATPRSRRFYEKAGWTCGEGDQVMERAWTGPNMPGIPGPPTTVTIIQYRRTLPWPRALRGGLTPS